MKLFNIYIKKTENQAIEDLAVINNGFSFTGFLFTFLWFLQHKMWKETIAFLLLNILFTTLAHFGWLVSFNVFAVDLGLALMIGVNANYWYEQHLLNNQYQFAGCVFGKNRDEAKLRFISNCFKDENQNNIFCPSIIDFKTTPDSSKQYFTA